MPTKPTPKPGRLALWLLYLVTGLLPLLLPPGLKPGIHGTKTVELGSGLAAIVSQVGIPPEFAWIWPRVVLLLAAAVLGLLFWRDLGFNPRRPFIWLLGIYLLTVLASALLAWDDDWNYRILGGVGRLDGPLYQFALALWAVLAYFVFQRFPGAVARFMGLLSVTGGAEALVLTLQRLGHDFIGQYLVGGPYPATVGTIGHPGMAAGFLLVAFFAAGWLAFRYSHHRWAWLALALWISVGIGITTNKSTTFAAVLVLLLLLATLRRREVGVILGIFLLGSLVITPLIPNRLGFARSLANPHTGVTRLLIWRLAGEVLAKTPGQPLVGAGPDGFLVGLITKVPVRELLKEYRLEYGWPEHARVSGVKPLFSPQDPLRSRAFLVELEDYPQKGERKRIIYRYYLDKAHNLFLDRAVAYGVLAALIWLGLFLWPLLAFYRRWRSGLAELGDGLLFGGLAALCLYYQAWSPVPQGEPLHVAYLALTWTIAESWPVRDRPQPGR